MGTHDAMRRRAAIECAAKLDHDLPFDERVNALADTVQQALTVFAKEHPHWVLQTAVSLAWKTFEHLRAAIDDPAQKRVTWRTPEVVLRYVVEWDWQKQQVVTRRYNEKSIPKSAQEATEDLAALMLQHQEVLAMDALTHGAGLWIAAGREKPLVPQSARDELESIPQAERQRRTKELYRPFVLLGSEKGPAGEDSAVPLRLHGILPDGQRFQVALCCEFCNLVVNADDRAAYFPIRVRLDTEDGPSLAEWPTATREKLWRTIDVSFGQMVQMLSGKRLPSDTIERPAPVPLLPGDHVITASAEHYQALREALAFNTFRKVEDNPWPTAILDKGRARGKAHLMPVGAEGNPLMPPEEAKALAAMMFEQQKQLSDLDADALDTLSALWLNQARIPHDSAIASVDVLLEMRGLKPKKSGQGRRGGYEPEQRRAVLQTFSRVLSLWLTMAAVETYEHGKRKPKTRAVQSRAFVVTDRAGQMRLDGHMDVDTFLFRPGEVFARFLLGPGRQTALLSAKALCYDPYRQKWEKRLTRYLSWQWRIRQSTGSYLDPYRVSTLLEAVGEEPDMRFPNRTKERLEKCLNTLEADKVIAGWQYAGWEEDATSRRGWVNPWLQALVVIEPPDAVKDHYHEHLPAKQDVERALPPPATLGQRMARRRQALGLTQQQAAEHLGIGQGHYSRLERRATDQTRMTPALRGRLLDWLGEARNA